MLYSGVMLYYIGMQVLLWLFFHTATLFWSVQCPFHFRSYQSNHRTRHILIAMTIAGLLLPLVPALVPLAGEGYRFIIRVPPMFCFAISPNDNIYSLLLPAAVIGASTLCLLVGIFWSIIKVRLTEWKNACIQQQIHVHCTPLRIL